VICFLATKNIEIWVYIPSFSSSCREKLFSGIHTDSEHVLLLHSILNLHGSPSNTELILVGDEVGGGEGLGEDVGVNVGFKVVGFALVALV